MILSGIVVSLRKKLNKQKPSGNGIVIVVDDSTTSCGRLSSTVPRRTAKREDLLQGTLDLLILRTLQAGPQHGHGIGLAIRSSSQDVLQVDHGSLYPALHRLEKQGWLEGEWRLSENKQRARYYRLTAAGRRQLRAERQRWDRLTQAISRVLGATG
jgi:PadR family transcriptional regulator PadR